VADRGVRGALVTLVIAGLVLVSACSSGSDLAAPAAPAGTGGVETPSAVYVALGGLETLNRSRDDIQDNWPQIVFAEQLPTGAVYVNFATEDATSHSVLQDQLPKAQALHPTVATVWVEAADVRNGTATSVYREQLGQVVEGLQSAGAQRVLLLTPSGSQADLSGGFADSVRQVATDTGAVYVDLGDTSGRQDDPGQRSIANTVMAAMGPA
jgi:hypothetical protein